MRRWSKLVLLKRNIFQIEENERLYRVYAVDSEGGKAQIYQNEHYKNARNVFLAMQEAYGLSIGQDKWMTVQDIVEHYNNSISKETIYNLIKTGQLKSTRNGERGKILVKESWLQEYEENKPLRRVL
jgi:hypothetical protein